MAVLQKVKINNEWVPVSGSNVNTGGGASSSNTLIIHSDKDFEVIEEESLVGVISDPNTTYNDIKNAIDNNYNIALKEPRGNLSYCLRADFVLEDQESGNKRIALFFTKSILTIRYDIILYIGLNNSIVYMISKNDIFSKEEVEESIDNKAPYVGEEEPTTDTVLWIDPTGTPSGGNGGNSGGGAESPYAMKVFIVPEGVMTATEDAPYTFSAEETEEFLAQGDFKRTIVKYPTQVLIGMGALTIADLCLYIESDSAQGFICEGTEVTEVSVESNGETDSGIEYTKTIINCANTSQAIMGYCSISRFYATLK